MRTNTKKLKKGFAVLMLMILIFSSVTAFARSVDIYVNGRILVAAGYIDDGTTYVPLRMIGETLGANVSWDGTNVIIEQNEDDIVSNLIKNASESVVAIVGNYKTSGAYNEYTAHGSGVVIKSNGTILTNAHVVDNLENITVVFHDGNSYAAVVKCVDKESDLAIIQINKLGLKPISFAKTSDIISGHTVIAIGTPLSLNMHNSATKGIISGKDVKVPGSIYPLVQTDAAINGGNSGGALIDLRGNLIGINSSKYAGIGIEGIAFSIPVDTINYVISQYEKNGKVLRPDIGVDFEESWEARIGLPTKKGITVKIPSSNQLKQGDVVTAVNGVAVHSIIDYNKAVRDTFTNSMSITYTRNGVIKTENVDFILK